MKTIATTSFILLVWTHTVSPGICTSEHVLGQFPKSSAPAAQDSLHIVDLQVEGNRLISQEEILRRVKTKPGDRFDREAIINDLIAIDRMHCFNPRNLRACPELSGKNGVVLSFLVQETMSVPHQAPGRYKSITGVLSPNDQLFSHRFFRTAQFDSITGRWIDPDQYFFRPRPETSFYSASGSVQKLRCDRRDVDTFLNGKTDTLKFYNAL